MDQRGAEGTEFVLDNRKLIIGFLVLILVCGAFFVIGFMEGKRQSVEAPVDRTPAGADTGVGQQAAAGDSKSAGPTSGTPAVEGRSVREQLDWYKNVQSGGGASPKPVESAKAMPPAAPRETQKAPAVAPTIAGAAATRAGSMVPAANINYCVQVGAFRVRREAESKVEALKAKGFVCQIEEPAAADQLYLVKVGKFKTRAEAAAMQSRLRKAGFSCFIKTN